MKELKLNNSNDVALLDDEDYNKIVALNLTWCKSSGSVSAKMWHKAGSYLLRKTVHIHRIIMGLTFDDKRQVDHINLNFLDNQRSNLRICSKAQNCCNKPSKNKHGYKGIYFCPKVKVWYARVKINGEYISLGRYSTAKIAALAYNFGAYKYHGEFAHVNII